MGIPAPGVTPLSTRILRWARGQPFTVEDARAMFGPQAPKAITDLHAAKRLVWVGRGRWVAAPVAVPGA